MQHRADRSLMFYVFGITSQEPTFPLSILSTLKL